MEIGEITHQLKPMPLIGQLLGKHPTCVFLFERGDDAVQLRLHGEPAGKMTHDTQS